MAIGSWLREKLRGEDDVFEPVETDYESLTGDDRIVTERGNGGVRSDLLRAELGGVGSEYESSVGVAAATDGVAIDVEINGESWRAADDVHLGALAVLDPTQARAVAANLEAAAALIEDTESDGGDA